MDIIHSIASFFNALIGWVVGGSLVPDAEFSVIRWALRPATAVMVLVIFLELVFPKEKRPWTKQHLLTFTHFVMAAKVSLFAFVMAPAIQWVWIRYDLPSLHLDQTLHPVAFVVVTLLVYSFIDYWSHRLLHRIPLLWHVHKIHHAPTQLTWASTFQEHFAMTITSAPMLTVSTLLLGTHLVPPWGAFHILINYLQHSNVAFKFGKLNYFFALPEVHRYHHCRDPRFYDTNFSGGFTIWDHVFRTFYYNPKDPALEFGLDEPVPTSWHRQQIEPLKWIGRDIWGSRLVRAMTGRSERSPGAPPSNV